MYLETTWLEFLAFAVLGVIAATAVLCDAYLVRRN